MATKDFSVNFDNVCRLCLADGDKEALTPIFGVTNLIYKPALSIQIESFVPIQVIKMHIKGAHRDWKTQKFRIHTVRKLLQVLESDRFSNQICQACRFFVITGFSFKCLCKNVDVFLKKMNGKEESTRDTFYKMCKNASQELKRVYRAFDELALAETTLEAQRSFKIFGPALSISNKDVTDDGAVNIQFDGAEKKISDENRQGPEQFKGCESVFVKKEIVDAAPLDLLELDQKACSLSFPASPTDNSNHDNFSTDDEVTLFTHRQRLLNLKKKRTRKKKKVCTMMRTVMTQTSSIGTDCFIQVDFGECQSTQKIIKLRSKKTQTDWGKKRMRVRTAVPSPCNLCEKVYKNGEVLRQHMKSHHVTGVIECEICQMKFTSMRSLKYHQHRNHTNIEPVPCSFCGKKFLDKKYLRTHENIHNQAHRFVCQFCGRSFVMKTNLTVHITRHHTEKRNDYVCQICGKAFPFKLYLKKHFKTHTDDKPHCCTHCDAKFRESTLLRKHINSIHLKLRPFSCQYCHKTFTRNLYLREHMESQHLGVMKKIECTQCGGSFPNRSRLKQHECTGDNVRNVIDENSCHPLHALVTLL